MVPTSLDQRRVAGLAGASLLVGILLTLGVSSAHTWGFKETAAATPAQILNDAVSCWPREKHVILQAKLEPSADVMKASLYFRWDRHADWYFVPMTPGPGGAWQAILPKTAAGTTGAVYYVESLNRGYVATRGSMHSVRVTPGNACQQQDTKVKTFEGDPQARWVRPR